MTSTDAALVARVDVLADIQSGALRVRVGTADDILRALCPAGEIESNHD